MTGWIITSTFCQLRRGKYKYREKSIFFFEKEKNRKQTNKQTKKDPSYIYRTLLKCISTHGGRKGPRIRTVKLFLKSFFIKVDF